MIIENIILTVYSSWEKFLEDTFISYMQGNISENGTAITVYVSPTSDDHAYNLIKNVTTYPDWTDVNKIMITAGNFFENGGPFQLLLTLKGDINAVKKIRNAIAHTSRKAREDFENLVRGKVGHLPNDMLEELIREIDDPYDEFSIETIKVIKPEFKSIGRNELCPCGSGKKYKKCHLGTAEELMDHHIVHMSKPIARADKYVGTFGTWK